MKTKSLPAAARRFVMILSALAAAAGLSSCTTGPMDHASFDAGYGPDHGSAWGSWEGRGHEGRDRDGRPGRDGRDGRDGRGDHGGHGGLAGDGRSGAGSGDMWIGPLPWPDGVRPDRVEPGRVGEFTPRLINPEIAGRLRAEPRGVDPGLSRPDIRLTEPGIIRAGYRPEYVRPADARLTPGTGGSLRTVSPESLRAAVTPSPRPSDIRLNPDAARHLRTVNPLPAAAVRPAATSSTLRVNPETLRNAGIGSGALRFTR